MSNFCANNVLQCKCMATHFPNTLQGGFFGRSDLKVVSTWISDGCNFSRVLCLETFIGGLLQCSELGRPKKNVPIWTSDGCNFIRVLCLLIFTGCLLQFSELVGPKNGPAEFATASSLDGHLLGPSCNFLEAFCAKKLFAELFYNFSGYSGVPIWISGGCNFIRVLCLLIFIGGSLQFSELGGPKNELAEFAITSSLDEYF